jgi:hypothetical protein
MKKKMASSTKKFIRKEKARIRREVLDTNKQEEAIKGVYEKLNNPEKTVVLQAKPAENKKKTKVKKSKKS